MNLKAKDFFGDFGRAAILAGLGWLLVWGFVGFHPEAGIDQRFAIVVMIVVFVTVLGFLVLRRQIQR